MWLLLTDGQPAADVGAFHRLGARRRGILQQALQPSAPIRQQVFADRSFIEFVGV